MDDFLLEKIVCQWIWWKRQKKYQTIFKFFLASPRVDHKNFETFTAKNIKMFLWDCLLKKKWSSSTYNSYRSCLKCYWDFLEEEWLIEKNPVVSIKERITPKQLPKHLTSSQLEELFNSLPVAFEASTFHWIRNITIVHTFVYTWLRLSELTNLKMWDLKINDGYIKVIKWKGGKDRVIPLSNEIIKILLEYLKARKECFSTADDVALFPSCNWYYLWTGQWGHMQEKAMRNVIERIRECITFHFTWHQLRHTFATELIRNNFDIYNVSKILGHSSINTTKIYLDIDTGKMKEQLDKISMFENVFKATFSRTLPHA